MALRDPNSDEVREIIARLYEEKVNPDLPLRMGEVGIIELLKDDEDSITMVSSGAWNGDAYLLLAEVRENELFRKGYSKTRFRVDGNTRELVATYKKPGVSE